MSNPNAFETLADAQEAMIASVRDDCVDNIRFAYVDDKRAMERYNRQQDRGCCGSCDWIVWIAGREAKLGCNYGH